MSQDFNFKMTNSPAIVNRLDAMFYGQWPGFQLSDIGLSNPKIPHPIAVICDDEVVGGLAFSLFEEPNTTAQVIWLNAVYIAPKYRGEGLASELISYAQSLLTGRQKWLYAHTDVPSLYARLGWCEVEAQARANHKVMRVSLQD
ncbi:MAG: GNAT family N-acetyltransferase [Psychrobium sp.]